MSPASKPIEPHFGDEFEQAIDAEIVRAFLDMPLAGGVENRMRIAANHVKWKVLHHVHPDIEPIHVSAPLTWAKPESRS